MYNNSLLHNNRLPIALRLLQLLLSTSVLSVYQAFITVTHQDDVQNLAEPELGYPLCTSLGDSMASGLVVGHDLFCQV